MRGSEEMMRFTIIFDIIERRFGIIKHSVLPNYISTISNISLDLHISKMILIRYSLKNYFIPKAETVDREHI